MTVVIKQLPRKCVFYFQVARAGITEPEYLSDYANEKSRLDLFSVRTKD